METSMSIIDHIRSSSLHHLLHHLKQDDYSQNDLDEALWYTTRHGDLQTTRLLLSYGANIYSLNNRGMPILHGVVIGGHGNILRCILDAGYNVNYMTGNSEETGIGIPLHIAVWKNDIEVIKVLVSAGVDTTPRDFEGNTAILIASITGSYEAVEALLSAECDVNHQNYKDESCLHLVVKNNHPQLIDAFLHSGIDVNLENEHGDTPLLLAARLQYVDIFDKLLNTSAVKTDHRNKDESNILHLLSPYADSLLVAKVLKITELPLGLKDRYGNTALNVAACYQNEELLLFLLSKSVDEDILDGGFMGRNVIHWVVINQMNAAFKLILERNLPLDDVDEDNSTPIMLACKNNLVLEMKILLHYGADSTIPDIKAWSPLHWACYKGFGEIVEWLIESSPGPTNYYETPLMLATKGNYIDIIEMLLENTWHARTVAMKDLTDNTVLHYAVENGNEQILLYLLQKGCDKVINKANGANEYAISIAARQGHIGMISILLQFNAFPNVLDKDGKSPLLDMIKQNCDIQLVKTFLENGANPNLDRYTSCCLIEATKVGSSQIVELLLQNGAAIDSFDQYNRTAFIWAAQKGHFDILKLLHDRGANTYSIDSSGDTALTVAAFEGHCDILEFLIPHSAIDHKEDEEGMTALLLALSNGHIECAQLLLDAGANVEILANNGNNALLTATAMSLGKSIVEQILLKGNPDTIHRIGEQERTVLHWAISDPETLAFFLQPEKQMDINKADGNGATALLLAIAHSLTASAMLLIQAGCDVNAVHDDGRQPIHHAAIYGEPEVLSSLLDMGIDCNTPTSDGRTPTLLASIDGNKSCAQILLEAGANVNEIYMDAITPLFAATNGVYHETMEILLEYGADPDLIGTKKVRPLIASIVRDDSSAVKLLLQWGSDVENYIDINSHPVTVALMKQRWHILVMLLEVLVNTNLVRRILKDGAIYYFLLDDSVRECLRNFTQSPVTLQNLCRQCIRDQIQFPKKQNIKKLHTSQFIEEYLLLDKL